MYSVIFITEATLHRLHFPSIYLFRVLSLSHPAFTYLRSAIATVKQCIKAAQNWQSVYVQIYPTSTSWGDKITTQSNFSQNLKNYKLVWAAFLWLSVYIYLTYSDKLLWCSDTSHCVSIVSDALKNLFFLHLPCCSNLMKTFHFMAK